MYYNISLNNQQGFRFNFLKSINFEQYTFWFNVQNKATECYKKIDRNLFFNKFSPKNENQDANYYRFVFMKSLWFELGIINEHTKE